MSKSLKAIQTIMKVLKNLSKIAFIACIVGAIITVSFGALCMFSTGLFDYVIDGVTIRQYVAKEMGNEIDISALSQIAAAICFSSAIVCAGGAAESGLAITYFEKELDDGTPFTFEGSDLLKKVARQIMVCSAITILASTVVYVFLTFSIAGKPSFNIRGILIAAPLFLYLLGVIFQYGAEQKQVNN